jgi:hypothetical protein
MWRCIIVAKVFTDLGLEVWTSADGVPERLVWNARRYWVTDRPTVLEVDLDYATMTHPPTMPPGWRLQATDEDGFSLMFDLRLAGERWRVVRTSI